MMEELCIMATAADKSCQLNRSHDKVESLLRMGTTCLPKEVLLQYGYDRNTTAESDLPGFVAQAAPSASNHTGRSQADPRASDHTRRSFYYVILDISSSCSEFGKPGYKYGTHGTQTETLQGLIKQHNLQHMRDHILQPWDARTRRKRLTDVWKRERQDSEMKLWSAKLPGWRDAYIVSLENDVKRIERRLTLEDGDASGPSESLQLPTSESNSHRCPTPWTAHQTRSAMKSASNTTLHVETNPRVSPSGDIEGPSSNARTGSTSEPAKAKRRIQALIDGNNRPTRKHRVVRQSTVSGGHSSFCSFGESLCTLLGIQLGSRQWTTHLSSLIISSNCHGLYGVGFLFWPSVQPTFGICGFFKGEPSQIWRIWRGRSRAFYPFRIRTAR